MEDKTNYTNFEPGNGIDDDVLMKYVMGELSPKEQNQVERHLLDAEASKDAVEGMMALKESGVDLSQKVSFLQKQVRLRAREQKKSAWKSLTVAATLLLLLGIGTYISWQTFEGAQSESTVTQNLKSDEAKTETGEKQNPSTQPGEQTKQLDEVSQDLEMKSLQVEREEGFTSSPEQTALPDQIEQTKKSEPEAMVSEDAIGFPEEEEVTLKIESQEPIRAAENADEPMIQEIADEIVQQPIANNSPPAERARRSTTSQSSELQRETAVVADEFSGALDDTKELEQKAVAPIELHIGIVSNEEKTVNGVYRIDPGENLSVSLQLLNKSENVLEVSSWRSSILEVNKLSFELLNEQGALLESIAGDRIYIPVSKEKIILQPGQLASSNAIINRTVDETGNYFLTQKGFENEPHRLYLQCKLNGTIIYPSGENVPFSLVSNSLAIRFGAKQ